MRSFSSSTVDVYLLQGCYFHIKKNNVTEPVFKEINESLPPPSPLFDFLSFTVLQMIGRISPTARDNEQH